MLQFGWLAFIKPFLAHITTTTTTNLLVPRGGLILTNDEKDLLKKNQFSYYPGIQGGPLEHIVAMEQFSN